jgi:hypothetical protein
MKESFMPLAFHVLSSREPRRIITAFIAGVSLSFAIALPAHADLKLTSKVVSSSNGSGSSIVYYKGKKMRSETDGSVVLFDGEKSTVTTLDLAAKTYSVVPLSALSNNPAIKSMDIQADVRLVPGGQTKTVLGKETKNYKYTATIKMSLKREMIDRLAAAARSRGSAAPTLPKLPTIIVTGENWVSEQTNLPSGAVASSMSALGAVPGLSSLVDKFRAIKGVPLESNVVISVASGQRARNQTMSTVATSLDEAELPDSLFRIPPGFVEVRSSMSGLGKAAATAGGLRP